MDQNVAPGAIGIHTVARAVRLLAAVRRAGKLRNATSRPRHGACLYSLPPTVIHPSTVRTADVSLVRFHSFVTTALTLGLAALAAWRGEAFLAGGSWTDLLVALVAGPAALGLVVYLSRLRTIFHREPGPGFPRDIED